MTQSMVLLSAAPSIEFLHAFSASLHTLVDQLDLFLSSMPRDVSDRTTLSGIVGQPPGDDQ